MYLHTILLITAINYIFINIVISGDNSYKKSTMYSIGYMFLSILPSIFIYGFLIISVGFVKAVMMFFITAALTLPGMVIMQIKTK